MSSNSMFYMVYKVETIKRQAKLRSVMGQPVSAGSAYGLRPTLAWPVTWPAPLKSRYVTWGALQELYAFAYAFTMEFRQTGSGNFVKTGAELSPHFPVQFDVRREFCS